MLFLCIERLHLCLDDASEGGARTACNSVGDYLIDRIMKKLVGWFVFVALFVGNGLFAGNAFAKNMDLTAAETSVVVQQSGNLALTLDLGDLTEVSVADVQAEIDEFISRYIPEFVELNCSVSVKGKVNIGVASIEITVEVSGPCSVVRQQGTAIANQILDEVKSALR